MVQHKGFQLIIFDCDGVLVDSERLYVELLIKAAHEYGVELEFSRAMNLFVGVHLERCIEIIEELIGRHLPSNFAGQYRQECLKRMETELLPESGIEAALSQIDVPLCVASNSPLERVNLMLQVAGISQYFKGRVYSGCELKKWKPQPDLFLNTAKAMGVKPEFCAVVEDSLVGIQAARAANMTAFRYLPNMAAVQSEIENVCNFQHMKQLPALLGAGAAYRPAEYKESLLPPFMVPHRVSQLA